MYYYNLYKILQNSINILLLSNSNNLIIFSKLSLNLANS